MFLPEVYVGNLEAGKDVRLNRYKAPKLGQEVAIQVAGHLYQPSVGKAVCVYKVKTQLKNGQGWSFNLRRADLVSAEDRKTLKQQEKACESVEPNPLMESIEADTKRQREEEGVPF